MSAVTWSRPVAPISPFVPEPDSFDQIPIIVPTAQLLSTMEDPSRGSQHTVNLPLGLQGLISGSSSDAPQATTAEDFTASHMIWSAMTSTESCASPKVLAEPSTVTRVERRGDTLGTANFAFAQAADMHAMVYSLLTY